MILSNLRNDIHAKVNVIFISIIINFRYTRNLVDEGNGRFNLMVLCWGEGHGSAIHDHSDAHCVMKMLQGELCEVNTFV